MTAETRIDRRFAQLKKEGRAGLVTYVMAGDPNYETSLELVRGLPAAGADIIELGLPFSDPMADGPAIQAAGLRALAAGMSTARTLDMVRAFRQSNTETPIVLMGYFNPIYQYPTDRFLDEAKQAGVDGLIIVDAPPEMDEELCLPAVAKGLNFIRLAAPTTDAKRLPTVLQNTSGFVYYVSITGITGTAAPDADAVGKQIQAIKRSTTLPVAVGFGVKSPEQVRALARQADAVVVGSALIGQLSSSLDAAGKPSPSTVSGVLSLVKALSSGLRG